MFFVYKIAAKAKGIYQEHAEKGKMTVDQFLEQHADIIELLQDRNQLIF